MSLLMVLVLMFVGQVPADPPPPEAPYRNAGRSSSGPWAHVGAELRAKLC